MIISSCFIKRKINELIQATGRKCCYKTLDEVTRVIVLYNTTDEEEVDTCIAVLKNKGKLVLAFKNTGFKVNYLGFPEEAVLQSLDDFKPDMLIDLTRKESNVMQYLALSCSCNFKVGMKRGNKALYDLTIGVTTHVEINYLFEQIIFYLQTIRSR